MTQKKFLKNACIQMTLQTEHAGKQLRQLQGVSVHLQRIMCCL